MTKKDYEVIAQRLRYCNQHCDSDDEANIVEWVSEHIADALLSTNPRFDRERFITACSS